MEAGRCTDQMRFIAQMDGFALFVKRDGSALRPRVARLANAQPPRGGKTTTVSGARGGKTAGGSRWVVWVWVRFDGGFGRRRCYLVWRGVLARWRQVAPAQQHAKTAPGSRIRNAAATHPAPAAATGRLKKILARRRSFTRPLSASPR
ncbi:unnamed protein product [Amoebophrya sp. A120]|nr:unnamed protein product [Amoebophrya sp. A120]|eukprot:GSA120T00022451001.1